MAKSATRIISNLDKYLVNLLEEILDTVFILHIVHHKKAGF